MQAIKRNELIKVFTLAFKLYVAIYRQAMLLKTQKTPPISNIPPVTHFKAGTRSKDPSRQNSDDETTP
jgi:hypothetical protein